MQLTGAVINELRGYESILKHIAVDAIGIGAGVTDRLKEEGFPAIGVNVSGGSMRADGMEFANRRAYYYWFLREIIRSGRLGGYLSPETISQLTQIHYGYKSNGEIFIESKDDMTKRGMKSPDHADGLMLCFAPIARSTGNWGYIGQQKDYNF